MVTRSKKRLSTISSSKTYSLILVGLLFGCVANTNIEGFDSKAWKSDKYGCKDLRKSSVDALVKNQDQLMGMAENSILQIMGRPDKNELYNRDQKFYTYYTEPSHLCQGMNIPEGTSDHIILRFNSIGLVSDIKVISQP